MILAAGRGERMRPLTDALPKPLVVVRGAPLIVHHIEALVAIGVRRIVINLSYQAQVLREALGDGARFGCEIVYSVEAEPLESGGGVATASAHFRTSSVILVSADIHSDFDYAHLLPAAQAIENGAARAHFVLVPPTPGEPGGEFALTQDAVPPGFAPGSGRVHEGEPRRTLANIAVLSSAACRAWPRGTRFRLLPHYREWVAAGVVSGAVHRGLWRNVTTIADVHALNGEHEPGTRID